MRDKRSFSLPENGPSAGDLAAIEREWPVIEAELALLDEQLLLLATPAATADRRRLRRAYRRVLTARLLLALDELDDNPEAVRPQGVLAGSAVAA